MASLGTRTIAALAAALVLAPRPALAHLAKDGTAGATTLEPASPRPRGLIGWGNDQFYNGAGDDVGFTQDLSVELHLLDLVLTRADLFLRARQRLIIERYGPRRTDEMTFDLRWLHERTWGPCEWTYGPAIGLALSGNYGGAELQNAWHHLIENGYTFENGLANTYGEHRTGLLVGGRAGPSFLPYPWLRLLVGTDLQVALGGTGLSRVALYDAVEVEPRTEGIRFALSAGVDFERTWTRDPSLELPGAYVTGHFEKSAHLRVAARGDQWEFGYEGHTNVGGAGTHLGVVYVMLGGGNAFRHEHARR